MFAGELWLNDGLGEHFDERYLAWIEHSIVHGFASLYKSSAAEYSGTDDFGLGYVIHQREDDWLIDVYDAAHGGNGASRLVAKYMHLPDLERDLIARAEIDHLPTTSFGDLVIKRWFVFEYIRPRWRNQRFRRVRAQPRTGRGPVPSASTGNWNGSTSRMPSAEPHLRRDKHPIPAGMEEARHYLERELALDMCGVECDSCRLNDASIHPPHVARFPSVRSHLDVALTMWSLMPQTGVTRHREQQTEIRNLAGTNTVGFPLRVEAEEFVGHHVHSFTRVIHPIMHRFTEPPATADRYVRVRTYNLGRHDSCRVFPQAVLRFLSALMEAVNCEEEDRAHRPIHLITPWIRISTALSVV